MFKIIKSYKCPNGVWVIGGFQVGVSVFHHLRILVFGSHFELLLPLHVAVGPHAAQVATVEGQQHHGGRKGPVPNVSQTFSGNHGYGLVFREKVQVFSPQTLIEMNSNLLEDFWTKKMIKTISQINLSI